MSLNSLFILDLPSPLLKLSVSLNFITRVAICLLTTSGSTLQRIGYEEKEHRPGRGEGWGHGERAGRWGQRDQQPPCTPHTLHEYRDVQDQCECVNTPMVRATAPQPFTTRTISYPKWWDITPNWRLLSVPEKPRWSQMPQSKMKHEEGIFPFLPTLLIIESENGLGWKGP